MKERYWFNWPVGFRCAACATYAGLVTWLSLAPASTFSKLPAVLERPGMDKLAHFLMYGLLVLLVRWALAEHWKFRLPPWSIVAGASAYGLAMEIAQALMAQQYHRTFDVGDVIANTAGASVSWWLAGFLFDKSK